MRLLCLEIIVRKWRRPRRLGHVILEFAPHLKRRPKVKFLDNAHYYLLGIKPVNKLGQPAPIDGAPAWEIVNADPAKPAAELRDVNGELALWPADDLQGDIGRLATVRCTFDADLGEGVQSIGVFQDIVVGLMPAVGGTIEFGEPIEK